MASIPSPANQPSAAIGAYIVLSLSALVGIALLWRRDDRGAVVLLVVVAVLARAPFVLKQPFLSSDAYRYLWDGRALLHGFNPYVIAPNSPVMHWLRLGWLYQYVDWHWASSIYPPLDLALFALADRLDDAGLLGIKTLVEIGDLTALWVLIAALRRRGIPAGRAALYGWSPLVIMEFAWSGHEEAWCVAALVVAIFLHDRGGRIGSALALAGAVLVKLYPLALIPAFFPRKSWGFACTCLAVVVLAYLPFALWNPDIFGFLSTFVAQYHQNDTLHLVLGTRGSEALFGLCVAAAFYARSRGADLVVSVVMLVLAYLLLAPSVYPWYVTVFAALLPLIPDVLSGRLRALMIGLLCWIAFGILGYAGEASIAARVTEYAPLFVGAAIVGLQWASERTFFPAPAPALASDSRID
ncbi:MAG: hypothetical protein GIW99_09420 [Candidatus Eremiobacteraeota bacterium]|nr:hypothetical protein [Candidatus Eremiobacteraeota bacterium]